MPNTIVALATPTGRSGIGVVRLSGSDALEIAKKLVDDSFSPDPRMAYLRPLRDPRTGDVIDEAIITYFKAPHSFTGEDVVEISCHGSPVILRQVIDICLRLGARMAEAGEFSLRALANGRMNLAEAEAIRDLIDAQTVASARQAVRQMQGEFSNQLQPIKGDLLDVIVVLESALEFVEDDLPAAQEEEIKQHLSDIAARIERIAETFQAGRLIRDGLKVALVGRPNAGKSSLFNSLLGSERAIVTEIAGTTRDQLHEKFTINDIPISLIDTAGLRETTDTVESIGVRRSRQTMADADLVIVMLDASEELTAEDEQILHAANDLNHLIVLNKIDLLSSQRHGATEENEAATQSSPPYEGGVAEALRGRGRSLPQTIQAAVGLLQSKIQNPKSKILAVSARTGEGLDELRQAIVRPFTREDVSTSGFLVSDARHHDLLLRSGSEIRHSLRLLDARTSEEITLIPLHNALRFLGQITGETTTEDMLSLIFSTFCIGK